MLAVCGRQTQQNSAGQTPAKIFLNPILSSFCSWILEKLIWHLSLFHLNSITCFKHMLAIPLKGTSCPQKLSKLVHCYDSFHCFQGVTPFFNLCFGVGQLVL